MPKKNILYFKIICYKYPLLKGILIMSDEYDITTKLEKEVLEWVVENYGNIEAVTPRMLIKIMDMKQNEPDRWKEMANIKFGA